MLEVICFVIKLIELDLNKNYSVQSLFKQKSETNSFSRDDSFHNFFIDELTETSSISTRQSEQKYSKSQSLSCEPIFDEYVFEEYSQNANQPNHIHCPEMPLNQITHSHKVNGDL